MLAITIVALCIYGIIDCARTPKESMPGHLPKPVWIVVSLIPVVGALLWLLLSWPIKHPSGFGTIEIGRGRPRKPEPEGPIAPDDDPEFLRDLEQDIRRRKHHPEKSVDGGDGDAGTGDDTGKDTGQSDAGEAGGTNRSDTDQR